MDVEQVLHVNVGEGDMSYANKSLPQVCYSFLFIHMLPAGFDPIVFECLVLGL